MARGKRAKTKQFKRYRDDENKTKLEAIRNEEVKKPEEKFSDRASTYFKSEELQEICSLLNIEEFEDHHWFQGAVVIGKFDIVKKLLKDGCCIDCVDENKETALMHAVKHFRLEMVDFLLTRGADISLLDCEGNNVLLLAAQSTLWDQDSFSCLWNSVCNNQSLCHDHTNQIGYSLLHYVTKRQWKTVLDLLLSVPVCLDCCTNKGVTPLIMAASRGDYVFVKALVEAGADISIEDQQKCTALCYAVAFSLQKNITESNRALELLLAAVNDGNSKLPLELYLQRRLELLVDPPKSKIDFNKTVSSVLVHVLTFFARFIYSGIDLLLEMSVFDRLCEAVERHIDDLQYTMTCMGVVLELVRHCDCCCQGLSQSKLADAFFNAGLGKCCIKILNRYGTGKTAIIKTVFLPLFYTCTSESYKARTWLESSNQFLQPYYNKYTRSFPIMFLETHGEPHLEIEKRCSISFQKLMKTLKSEGIIITKEEHLREDQKLKEDMILAQSVCKVIKPSSSRMFSSSTETKPLEKMKNSKPLAVYNSIIQHNFGKLDIVQMKNNPPKKEKVVSSIIRRANTPDPESTIKIYSRQNKSKKCRLAIKEIQQKQISESLSNDISEYDKQNSPNKSTSVISDLGFNKTVSSKHEVKGRFSEGYQLFQIEDEPPLDENENFIRSNTCDWLDACALNNGNKIVTDIEVGNTINYLREIFSRIICRYDSTWKKQYEEGYLGASGDCEDLLKLMSVLPALENYHIEKLIQKWDNFCKQIQNHVKKNHIVYAATVSEMQLFLLEFEAELDRRNVKIFHDDENLSLNSYVDTENVLSNFIYLSNEKQTKNVISINKKVSQEDLLILYKNSTNIIKDCPLENIAKAKEFKDNIYMSDSEDEEDNLPNGIWDENVLKQDLAESKFNVNKNNNTQSMKSNTTNMSVEEFKNVTAEKELTSSKNKCSTLNKTKSNIGRCDYDTTEESKEGGSFDNNTLFIIPLKSEPTQKLSTENVHTNENNEIITEITEMTVTYVSKGMVKPPPGFENVSPLSASFESLASVLAFSGTKYQDLSLDLVSLPACKTELLDGGLRLAAIEFQPAFKLFTGCNFGTIELGLSATATPLAVRRFQKFDNLCNKAIRTKLYRLLNSMLSLKHKHILPYTACYDLPQSLVFATPLCYQDLGQYIRQICLTTTNNYNIKLTLMPHLITMVWQVIAGLHFLHTQDKPITHGNLKPSNVLVDASGAVRLAEFGLHEVLFQQHSPVMSSMIWWSRDCLLLYYNTWKFISTQRSDIQTAGMLVHYIMTIGQHPYGQNLSEIIENIKNGVVFLKSLNVIAMDLVYWMLSCDINKRPTTYDILRHILFWSNRKKWEFLLACCELGNKHENMPQPIESLSTDLDNLAKLNGVSTKWMSVLNQNYDSKTSSNAYEDNTSGLFKFIKKYHKKWPEIKEVFIELFPTLPLNLYRLLEQTVWINRPEFVPFTRVELSS